MALIKGKTKKLTKQLRKLVKKQGTEVTLGLLGTAVAAIGAKFLSDRDNNEGKGFLSGNAS